jgi:hypothetical protein
MQQMDDNDISNDDTDTKEDVEHADSVHNSVEASSDQEDASEHKSEESEIEFDEVDDGFKAQEVNPDLGMEGLASLYI